MKKNTIMIPKMIILEFFGWCREREQRDLCERERERERGGGVLVGECLGEGPSGGCGPSWGPTRIIVEEA